MSKIHDFDSAWKTILEAFEQEVVEVMFPELYTKIDWEKGTESLDQELQEIQKEIFEKQKAEKVISDKIIKYNFRTIDVETINIDDISENNPLRLVFKIAKELLNTKSSDEAIYEAKIKLANELKNYQKVKNDEQKKALVYLLEYLFLIEDIELEKKYNEFKKSVGGVLNMAVDEIREKHLERKGIIKVAVNMIKKGKSIEEIMDITELSYDTVVELKEEVNKN